MSDPKRSGWVLTEVAPDGSSERAATWGGAEGSDGVLEVGRDAAGLAYPDDAMADRQLRLVDKGTDVLLEDLADDSGVWLRIAGSEGRALSDGDQVWLGAQILIFRGRGASWVIRHHGPDGRLRDTHPVPPKGYFLGRGSELVLDPDDAQLSRRHAQVAFVDDALRYFDRGAQNGSFIRLRAPETVAHGAEFRVATRRFRLEDRPVARELAEPAEAIGPPEAVQTPAGDEPVRESTRPIEPPPDTTSEKAEAPPAFEEATVLNLPVEDEPPEPEPEAVASAPRDEEPPLRDLPEPERVEPPRPRPGLGARLRRLGRQPVDPEPPIGSQAASEPEERTVAVPIAPAGETESAAAPDARVPHEDGQRPPEPEAVERPPASDRVPLVLDSPDGSVTLEVEPGCSVLEAVQQAGLERGQPVDWECGDGGCGVCIVGVVEGADRLDPPDPASGEMQTIQITEQVAPDPTRYRLACLARVRGAVRLRKLT